MRAVGVLMPVGLLAGLSVAPAVLAQAPPAPPAQAAVPAMASKPFPCVLASSPLQKATVAAAEALFDASWLKSAGGRDTAFTTRAEVVSPFAIKDPKAEPPRPAISGFVHAEKVECRMVQGTGSAGVEAVVEFFGLKVRFYEDGKWSAPIKRGLLMAVLVTSGEGGMTAVAKPEAPTVILPDAALRQPISSEVPPLAVSKPGAKAKKG